MAPTRERSFARIADELPGLCGVICVVLVFGWPQIRPGTSVPGDFLASIQPWNVILPAPPSNPLLYDPALNIYPNRKFVNDELQRGNFPLWNPYIFAGQPAVADSDMALFYPETLALGWMSAARAFDAHILIHLFVAAFGMFTLVRLWGGGQLAGVMAAAVFLGSSAMTVWRLYGNPISVAAWLPWLLVCFEMSLRRRSTSWVGAGAIVLGLIFTGNFLQWALYDLLLLATYVVWVTVSSWRERQSPWLPLLHAGAIVVLGLGIGAVQEWPLAELASLSQRSVPMSFERLLKGILHRKMLLTALAPNFFGSPLQPGSYWGQQNYAECTVYWGFYPLILSLTAPLLRPTRPVWFLWSFLLLSASWTVGAPTLRVFTWLPGFNVFMHERMIFLLCFCGAALSALTLESLFRPGRAWALGIVVVLALVGWAIVWQAAARLPPAGATTLDSVARVSWLVVLGLPLLAAGAWRPSVAIARVGLSAMIVIELARFSLAYTPRSTDEHSLFPPPHFLSVIPPSIVPPRFAAIDKGNALLLPNSLMPLGLAEIGGYSSLIQGDSGELVRRINLYADPNANRAMPRIRNPNSPLLDLAGVEYLAATKPLEIGGGRLELVDFAENVFLYRNHRAAPRAFVVAQVRARDGTGDWKELSAEDFAYCRFATLRLPQGTPPPLPTGHEGCVGSATITAYAPNRVDIRAVTPEDGLLVLTDSYFSGWKATVDGVERAIHQVDGVFRGLWLEAGDHEVHFEYRPRSVIWGGVLSAVATIFAIGLTMWTRMGEILRRLPVVACVGLFVLHFALIASYAVDVPYMDEWDIPMIWHGSDFSLARAFQQENEHRVPTTNLLIAVQYFVNGWDIRVHQLLNFLIYGGLILLLARFARRASNDLPAWVVPAFLVFLLSPIAWENHFMAFQCQVHLWILFFILATATLFTDAASWLRIACGCFMAVLSSYSFASGVVATVVLLVSYNVYQIMHLPSPGMRRMGLSRLAFVDVAVGIPLILWRIGWTKPGYHPPLTPPTDWRFWDTLLNIISFGFGIDTFSAVLGLFCLAIVVAPVLAMLFRDRTSIAIDDWATMTMIAGLLTVLASVALGRAGFEFSLAKTSRYAEFGMLLIPLSVILWSRLLATKQRSGALLAAALWIFCFASFFDNWWWFDYYAQTSAERRAGIECLRRTYAKEGDGLCPTLYPQPLGERLPRAKRMGLSFYQGIEAASYDVEPAPSSF